MHDRLFESETFGQALDLGAYRRPLVLAPHPDDEIFGCGGTLALWARQGVRPRVVVLTGGEQQDGSGPGGHRPDESQAAAAILGHEVVVRAWPDRGLRCDEAFIAAIAAEIEAFDPDVVLAPALNEPHPDHQACALALCCALARRARLPDVLLYESGGALTQATVRVDITAVRGLKDEAMAAFASQEDAQPYASRIRARDHYRALTLGPEAEAAEAFHQVPTARAGWPALVPAFEPLFMHGRDQAVQPADLPLVSVIVRSVGDPHLEATVASVAAQTYPRIELVVVAAQGQAQPAGLHARPGMTLKWVHEGGPALNRPRAANRGLDAAGGDALIFLDDDDLWTPNHLSKLVQALQAQAPAQAVHTDVRVIDLQGRELTRYDQAYRPERIAFTNVFPIHSVLFRRSLVEGKGACRFDETLPVLEDWDFWLQVTGQTDVPHVPGVSAFYRYRDRSGLQAGEHQHHHRQWRDRVMARWLARWPQERLLQAVRWHTGALDEAQQRLAHALAQAAALVQTAAPAPDAANEVRAELAAAAQQLAAGEQARSRLAEELLAAQALAASRHDELLLAQASLGRAEQARAEAAEEGARAAALQADLRLELALASQQLAQVQAEADRQAQAAQATQAQLQAQLRRAEAELKTAAEALAAAAAVADARAQERDAQSLALVAAQAELKAAAQSLGAQSARADDALQQREAAVQQLAAVRAEWQVALGEVRAELQAAAQSLSAAVARADGAQQQRDALQAELRTTRAELQAAAQSLAAAVARADGAQQQRDALQAELHTTRAELQAAAQSLAAAVARADGAQQQRDALQAELHTTRAELQAAAQSLAAAVARADGAQQQADGLAQRLEATAQELSQAGQSLSAAVVRGDALAAERTHLQAHADTLQQEVARLQAHADTLQQEVARLQGQVSGLEVEQSRLLEQQRRLETSWSWRLTRPLRWLAQATGRD